LSSSQAALIPPGIYYVNSNINIPSNRVLRGSGSANCTQGRWLSATFIGDTGAGATCTTLKLGSGGGINIGTRETRGSKITINSGYTKGSKSLTLASVSGLSVGTWVSIFETGDSAIPTTPRGDIGTCTWCGENNGSNLIQQFAQITAINGTTITISRPLYYAYAAGNSPGVKTLTFSVQRAGIEDIKLNGRFADHGAFVTLEGALFSWVKNIETYDAGTGAKTNHVNVNWSHGAEIRDSHLHFGRDSSSDRNYGIAFFFWNSDHKVENNILRNHRHSISFEGGGSGSVILYNYIDDNYTDDLSYLGSARTNHGAHPMMNLFEGNWISHLTADSYWGSSSHITYFRNWLRGDESGIDVPQAPNWGFYAADIWANQNYYSVVGNVLGVPSWTSGTIRNSGNCNASTRVAYKYGCDSNGAFSSATFNSILSHGNYDYISDGVALWDGGADHLLRSSMYYTAKPTLFGNCAWPVFGPDLTPMTGVLPAKQRYDGLTCGATSIPAGPTNLQVQ
jgi:hypothetical protein